MITTSEKFKKKDMRLEARKEDTEPVSGLSDEFSKRINQSNFVNDQINDFVSLQWKKIKQDIKQFENSRTLEQLGDIHFLKNNLSRTKKYYLKAIELDASFLAIYDKLIIIYLKESDINSADDIFKKMLKITNRRSDYLHKYILFKSFFFKEKYTFLESSRDIKEVIEKNPKDHEALNTYGFLYLKEKNIDNAILYFEKALEVNPDYSHSLNNLGVCYQQMHQIEKAKDYYEMAIKGDAFYVAAYENLANYYINKKEAKKALTVLIDAISKGVAISSIWQHQIAWLYLQFSEFKKAIKWYHKLIEIEPGNDLLYNNLGYCFVRTGRIEEGIDCFRFAVDILRKKIKNKKPCTTLELLAFYNLGRDAIRRGDLISIKKIYKEIHRYSPNDAFADYLQGSKNILEKNYSEAKSYYLKSLEKRRDIPEIYTDLSFIFESIEENYSEAIKLLERAMKMGFNHLFPVNNLIYAYIENGDLDKAKVLLNIFKEEIPPVIYANKGLLAYRKNDFKKGDYYYEKAVRGFSSENRKIAKQYWYIEKCKYYIKKNNKTKTEEYLLLLKENKETYMESRIERVEDEFKKIFYKAN